MRRANLHPNPLSGWSEDYPDPDEDRPRTNGADDALSSNLELTAEKEGEGDE